MLYGANYIDLVIVGVILFFVVEGIRFGFFVILADLLAFLGSLVFALRFYKNLSAFIEPRFNLTNSTSKAVSFLAISIVAEYLVGLAANIVISKIPRSLQRSYISRVLSIIPAVFQGLVFVAIVSTLVLAFPTSPLVKDDIVRSKLGGIVVAKTQGFEVRVNEVFGGVIEDAINYLTIEPGSNKRLDLNVKIGDLSVDLQAESEMFSKVNEERTKVEVGKLRLNDALTKIARERATDMWSRKYFGHVTPDGKDVADYLDQNKIGYQVVGENIALAPTISIAHTGLMNSQGHRENILNPDYSDVGIGVIDNGVYGKMFVQVFVQK